MQGIAMASRKLYSSSCLGAPCTTRAALTLGVTLWGDGGINETSLVLDEGKVCQGGGWVQAIDISVAIRMQQY
jgi:hypothetical protein